MKRSNAMASALVTTLAAVATVVAVYRAARIASLGAAYKAKILCSGIFVAGRDPASILEGELAVTHPGILRRIKTVIDYRRKEVTCSILGLIKRTARLTPGFGCSLCYGDAPGSDCAASLSTHATEKSPELPERIDPRLDPTLEWAFAEPDPATMRRTRAVVVLQENSIIAERYAAGFHRETPLAGWSMTKAVINALVGILVRQGRISLGEPVPVPEWQRPGDPRGKITLEQLLQMSSGLRFVEDYGKPLQDVTLMLFATPDAAAYAAAKPLEAEPGTRWSYSSGSTNIISRIIREILGEEEYASFPKRELFDRIGMSSAVMERDASGTYLGSSFMYATARDWGKLGQLYLQDGVWEGERILPEGWVHFSTTPAPSAPHGEYGAHLWLKIAAACGEDGGGMPADAFHAAGHEGQFLSVIPSRRLVIVRLGLTAKQGAWQHERFIEKVLTALES
jgi:CubicO group peptidase (beta-lactamase class C family)